MVSARRADRVLLRAGGETHTYDDVVVATHADQALRILDDPSREEARLLGAFRYAENRAVLHEDCRLMPLRRRAWASWNYLAQTDHDLDRPVSVTYWMNRLQKLGAAPDLFVSLNPLRVPSRIHAEFVYDHPQFDQHAIDAQGALANIQGVRRTWFCGSYFGFGFHEDALSSALSVAAAFGLNPPWSDDPPLPMDAELQPEVMAA